MPSIVPGEVLVKFRTASTRRRKTQNLGIAVGAVSSSGCIQIGIDLVRLPAGQSVLTAVEAFQAMPEVELAPAELRPAHRRAGAAERSLTG